jgi:hypothetical protein
VVSARRKCDEEAHHASDEARERPDRKKRRTRPGAIAHEGPPARDRDRRVENRGREKNCEGEGKTVKKPKRISRKKKPAHPAARKKRSLAKKTAVSGSRKTRSRAPQWIGKIADLTRELNLKDRRIYQLAHEGLPNDRGVYDVVACFRWYVRFLQRKILERALPEDGDGDGGGPATSATATRHKMLSIESELKQIELAEKREQLVSIEKVTKDLQAIVVEIRTRILALPPRLAAEVLGETDLAVSQVKIDRSLKGALEALSEFDPDDAVAASSTSRSRTTQ